MKTAFEDKFLKTGILIRPNVEEMWDWIKLNFISKQKIQTALAETSNWNCKEVLTKLLEDQL